MPFVKGVTLETHSKRIDKLTCRQGLTAGWVLLAASLIVWPFSIRSFSSQLVGAAMLLPCLLPCMLQSRFRHDLLRTASWFVWIPLLLLMLILIMHWMTGSADTGVIVFALYMVKIPVLYLLTRVVLSTLQQAGFSADGAQRIIWLAVLGPLTVVLAQLLLPEFHAWSIEQLGGFRAAQVISNDAQGHPFRFLGPNGFLFASHGVAFAFTAIGLLCFRTLGRSGRSLWLLGIECSCLLMAILSARSVLPLIAVYLVVLLVRVGSWRRRLEVLCAAILLVLALSYVAMLSPGGQQLIYWITEPVRTSLIKGKLSSNSVDATLETYSGISRDSNVTGTASNITKGGDWLGFGVYFRDNKNYQQLNLIGSDSGFVRIIYVSGYTGLALFLLFWFILTAHAWYAGRSRNPLCGSNGLARWFLVLFVGYGLLFFFKSEWLYQNFFVFQFLCLYHYFQNQHQTERHLRASRMKTSQVTCADASKRRAVHEQVGHDRLENHQATPNHGRYQP